MTTFRSLPLLLAVFAACTNSSSSPAKPPEPAPKAVAPAAAAPAAAALPAAAAPAIAAPAVAAPAAPAPAAAEPDEAFSAWLDALVADAMIASSTKLNATSFGPSVEVYLITTAGAATQEPTGQKQTVSLLLTGNRKAVVAELDTNTLELFGDDPTPVGHVEPFTAFEPGHRFDPESDANFSAPPFRGPSPPLVIANTVNYAGDKFAYLLTHEKDTLVVWYAESIYEDYTSTKWKKRVTVTLAPGAEVTVQMKAAP